MGRRDSTAPVIDPVLEALRNAPEDDEPETPEEARVVAEAKAEIRRGQHLSTEELNKILGL